MASRTAYVPTAGTAITAANHIKFPGGWIGYNEVTGNQTGIAATTDLTGLAVTVTVGTSRRIKVTGHVKCQTNTATAGNELRIQESATTLNTDRLIHGGTAQDEGLTATWVGTPSAGSHTYKLTLTPTAGTTQMSAAATTPAFILVEDMGPSS